MLGSCKNTSLSYRLLWGIKSLLENILGNKEAGSHGQSHKAWGRVWDPEVVMSRAWASPTLPIWGVLQSGLCSPPQDFCSLVASSALCLPPSLLSGVFWRSTLLSTAAPLSPVQILKGSGSTSEATGCPRVGCPPLSNGPGGVMWYTAGK